MPCPQRVGQNRYNSPPPVHVPLNIATMLQIPFILAFLVVVPSPVEVSQPFTVDVLCYAPAGSTVTVTFNDTRVSCPVSVLPKCVVHSIIRGRLQNDIGGAVFCCWRHFSNRQSRQDPHRFCGECFDVGHMGLQSFVKHCVWQWSSSNIHQSLCTFLCVTMSAFRHRL